jgi:sugar (pentulose or hexulose) kinase
MRHVVGIDCGSQSAKVAVFDEHGRAVATGRHVLAPMLRPRHGIVQHPDDDLWTATATATRDAVSAFVDGGGDLASIAAIGVCPIRCCKAFLDADGRLVEPVMSWMDDRAYRPWLPDDARLATVTTASGYLTHRLSGSRSDTVANNIPMQWPVDGERWAWDDDDAVVEQFGLRRHHLVALAMPGDVAGGLTAEAAAATGLPTGVPVVHTANDKAVEMLGSGALDDRTALVSLGTYIAAMVHGTAFHASPAAFWTNFAAVPGRYLYESNGVRRGMWTLTWFLDLLGPEVAERAAQLGRSREEYLEPEAAAVPAGSDGLMTVLDWLATTDKPFRKGMMLGFDARHTRGHLHRSILEAIALTMHHHVVAMIDELGIDLDQIVVSGGGANSELFLRIFSDVFGVPAARVVGGGAALGAAMCAAAAAGIHADIPAAAEAMAPARQTFTPDAANGEVYRRMADTVYHSIRDATDDLFERAYPIFH